MGQVMSSQWLDIDCIVLHQSNWTSNEFTIAFPKFYVGPKSVGYDDDVKVFYCIKKNLLINYRTKHPAKVHVWAGISIRERTGVCIFDGIMRASLYAEILKETLLPFINRFCPDHRYMQDNDHKHTSQLVKAFFDSNGVNWWRTSPESLDGNPIENLWHELKEFIRREVKPKNKAELVEVIKRFWLTVDATKCQKYIRHLRKVIPGIIEVNGNATGY